MNKTKRYHKSKRGFTLLEAVTSVALFSIAAVMFATFMFTSTRMVNLSLVYDSDREALIKAIESYQEGDVPADGITITVQNPQGGEEQFTLKMTSGTTLVLKGKYVTYKTPGGRSYSIYVGEDPTGGGG